jgi:hypothetical protein
MMSSHVARNKLFFVIVAVLLSLQVLCALHCHVSSGEWLPAKTGFICHLPEGEGTPQPLGALALQLVYGIALMSALLALFPPACSQRFLVTPLRPLMSLSRPPLLPPPRCV